MSVQRPGPGPVPSISDPKMYIHSWYSVQNVCKVEPRPRIKDHGRQTIWINMRTNANWMSAKWHLRVWKTAHSLVEDAAETETGTEAETGTATGDWDLSLDSGRVVQFARSPAAFWAILFNSTLQFIYICGRIILQLFKKYYQFVCAVAAIRHRGQLLWLRAHPISLVYLLLL